MKKISAAFGLALLSLTLLSSCTKSDYNSGSGQTGFNPFYSQPPATDGSFTAKVNGYGYTADIAKAATNSMAPGLSVSGMKYAAIPEGIMFTLPDEVTPGTYVVGQIMAFYKFAGSTESYMCTSGKVVVESKDDKSIRGTFDFKLDGVNITEGKFDIKLSHIEL